MAIVDEEEIAPLLEEIAKSMLSLGHFHIQLIHLVQFYTNCTLLISLMPPCIHLLKSSYMQLCSKERKVCLSLSCCDFLAFTYTVLVEHRPSR